MILLFFWKTVHKFSACNKVQANFFYDNFFMSDRKQSIYFNPIRSGGGALKAPPPPPIFCSHAFNIGAALLCVGDFSQKIV